MSYLARSKQTETRLRQTSSVAAGPIPIPAPPLGTDGLLQPSAFGFGDTVATLLAMSLDQFGQQGASLEIRVPWHGSTLWFVPSGADAERLAQAGVNRGRVWTVQELTSLLSIPKLMPEAARMVALAKVEFLGEVVTVSAHPKSPSQKKPMVRGYDGD